MAENKRPRAAASESKPVLISKEFSKNLSQVSETLFLFLDINMFAIPFFDSSQRLRTCQRSD
jgi:hypothetical protein